MGQVHRVTIGGIAAWIALMPAALGSPEAEKLFRDGRRLLKRDNVAEACALFARSQQLEPKVGTALNLAACRERLGQTATAWATFLEAKALAARSGDPRRAAEAERRAAALEDRLAQLTIWVADERRAPGLTLRRNGEVLDAAGWNAASPLDPGEYTIEASAPGRLPWAKTVQLSGGDRIEVAMPALATAPAAAAPIVARAPAPPAVTPLGVERKASPAAAPFYALGLGALVGATSRESPAAGGRVVATMPLPVGALRGVLSAVYSVYEDEPTMPSARTTNLQLGLGADYVWPIVPQLALAAGLGVGLDLDYPNLGRPSDVGGWWSLRASPLIVRLARGRVELGLHTQLTRAGDEWTALLAAACDVFVF